jgi:hypothetical protein
MKDAKDVQLVPISQNLIHDNVGQPSDDPFARSGRTSWPSDVRKILQQPNGRTNRRANPLRSRRIALTDEFLNTSQVKACATSPSDL